MRTNNGDRFSDFLDFHVDDLRFTFWNFLPPATEQRFAAIKDAIASGVWAGRIVLDELGRILYGHDDYRAFRALGKPPRHIIHVKVGDRCTRADVESLIRLWRYCDGGLATRKERRAAIRHQLKITPQLSSRDIGRLLGVDKNTVQAEREDLEESGEIHQFFFPGGRGKTKGLPMTVSRDRKEAKKNAGHLLDAPSLEGSVYSPRVLRQRKVDRERDRMAELGRQMATPDNIHLLHCDFRDLDAKLRGLGFQPGDVDLWWCDPPWEAVALGVYRDLARLVNEWYKPGGILGVYPGTEFEDEANDILRQSLPGFKKIRRLVVTNKDAGNSRIVGLFTSGYQPILLFANGEPTIKAGYLDVYPAKREPKVYHDWQRTESETDHWLSVLTEPGQVVVDPFGGGFTTAACCLRRGLRCVSCDIEERNVNMGKFRVDQTWQRMEAAKEK